MAITFTQQQKRQKYLVFVLAGVVLLSLIVLWRGFLASPTPSSVPAPKPEVFRKIEIDFNVFEHPFFANIQEFPRISSFEATGDIQMGRENPFAPVGQQEQPTEIEEE